MRKNAWKHLKLWDLLSKERSPVKVGFWTALLVLGIALGRLFILNIEGMDIRGFFAVSTLVILISSLVGVLVGLIVRFICGRKVGLPVNVVIAIIVAIISLWMVRFWFFTVG